MHKLTAKQAGEVVEVVTHTHTLYTVVQVYICVHVYTGVNT